PLNEARALAIGSSGTRVYAGYDNRPFGGPSMDGHIVVIDTTSLAVVSDILLEPPYALALDSVGSALYATSNGFSSGGHVSVIDTATDLLREFPLGPIAGVGGLAVAPDASRVYVAESDVLVVVDSEAGCDFD